MIDVGTVDFRHYVVLRVRVLGYQISALKGRLTEAENLLADIRAARSMLTPSPPHDAGGQTIPCAQVAEGDF